MNERKHILVVEDEQHLAIGIKYNFEAEGYRVSVANDGATALQILEDHPIDVDLIVLDLMLPGMSGYTVCETIRENGDDVPILMLSARTLAEDRIRGFNVGADQYLQKPFDLEELLSRARNLLFRKRDYATAVTNPSPIGDEFSFGRAHINFNTFEATVAGEALKLTPIEMRLIRHFAENEGRVISRAELLESVWRQSATMTTRTVDNFVMRLRRYFEIDPARPVHFLSLRGAGYRFIREPEKAE